jgi:uncharacterized protein
MATYLRRILGLAIFGAAHYIFLWNGDILFSYSVGAIALLILLYGEWKKILIAMAVLVGIGFIPGADPAFGLAGVLGFILLQTVFLRVDRKVGFGDRRVPVFSMVLLVLGTVGLIAAIVFWVLPNGPKEPRVPVTVLSITMLVFGALSAKYHDPKHLRELRLGVGIYTFSFSDGDHFWRHPVPQATRSANPARRSCNRNSCNAQACRRQRDRQTSG